MSKPRCVYLWITTSPSVAIKVVLGHSCKVSSSSSVRNFACNCKHPISHCCQGCKLSRCIGSCSLLETVLSVVQYLEYSTLGRPILKLKNFCGSKLDGIPGLVKDIRVITLQSHHSHCIRESNRNQVRPKSTTGAVSKEVPLRGQLLFLNHLLALLCLQIWWLRTGLFFLSQRYRSYLTRRLDW